MSTILIPTDFSDNARKAFDYAIAVFGSNHKYILFNSYEEPRSTTASMISLRDILAESSYDSLREEEAALKQAYPEVELTIASEYGSAVDAVAKYANRVQAEIIVMGTAGASGLKRILLGSTAAAVLQKAEIPVIVVPGSYEIKAPKKVLFTADLQKHGEGELPAVFLKLLSEHGSSLKILTVQELEDDIDEEEAERGYDLHVMLNGYEHQFDTIYSDDIGDAIASYAREHDMDMLVTIPRKSTWFERLLTHSVSKELAEHLEVPMFAIH